MTATAQAQSPETRCTALTGTKVDAATIASSAVVPAGTPIESLKQTLPAFCRVRLVDRPSSDSEILTEVWLPLAGWNGRYRAIGNGGFAGNIYFDQMAIALKQGFATSGTDAGHEGFDAAFALGHPEKVKDFGWRAIHDTAQIAKSLIAGFYGQAPAHSYFTACSDGGREALMEAQRFPDDYDGILAGAPAYNWTALLSSGAQDEKVLHATPGSDIPVAKLSVIGNAVRAACDATDGIADGILNDPRACHFDPATLLCKQADGPDCLTSEQVNSLQAIYSPKLHANGTQIYPGYLPGAEDARGGWNGWTLGDNPAFISFSTGYFRNFVLQDPAWPLASFVLDRDYKLANQRTAEALNATSPNLKVFASRGGKLIVYHGWNDPAIPALSSVEYFDRVRSTMGDAATNSMFALYMVPGMLHCSGGPGAMEFGQVIPGSRPDAQHDIFLTLQEWVESQVPPENLISVGNGLIRPLCMWPAVLKYKGGKTNDPKSFSCVVGKP